MQYYAASQNSLTIDYSALDSFGTLVGNSLPRYVFILFMLKILYFPTTSEQLVALAIDGLVLRGAAWL